MGREVLALACPDWRGPSIAIDADNGEIAYANWRALALLGSQSLIAVVCSRLIFTDPRHNKQFFSSLERIRTSVAEKEIFVVPDACRSDWFSVTMHNPHGLYREVLNRSLQAAGVSSEIIFVEIARTNNQPSSPHITAFAEAFDLSPAETELVFMLGRGQTLEDAAAACNVQPSTIRQRLKQVLAKSGCRQKSDLVRLIASLC